MKMFIAAAVVAAMLGAAMLTSSAIILHTWQTVSDVVSNVVTILAICIGGFWAYWRYVRERTRWPRAEIDLLITHRRLDERSTVLHAKLKLHNGGRGLMKLQALRVDLQRVLPLGPEMRDSIAAGSPFNSTGVEAAWPLIEQHQREWTDEKPELEPGENDEFGLDFFIEPDDEVVFVYGYLQNVRKKRGNRELGWSVSSFYDITDDDCKRVTANPY